MAAEVSLLSWNVFNENLDAGRIAACLEAHNADVALLQEMTPDHIEAARSIYPHVEIAVDYLLNGEACHLAIASRFPLADVRVVEHFPRDKPAPTWLSRKMGWTEFLESLSAEIEPAPGWRLRLIVAHTSAAIGPTARMAETEAVAAAHIPEAGPCVFAADFNSLAKPWNAPLLALPLQYRQADFLVNERSKLEAWFGRQGFEPAARGVTYPRLLAQLDQIYVRGARVTSSAIPKDRHGSDHRPLVATLAA